jgi:membrane protein YdbS with pleckstrin-like domain
MAVRILRGKRGRSRYLGTDRAVATAVVLAVAIVLLIIGFTGPSVYFVLPGPTGWLYIAAVIIVATGALIWLFCVDNK